MRFYPTRRHCRWCGRQYKPTRDNGKDGFDSELCRVALHRAFKAWLANRGGELPAQRGDRRS